MACCLLCLLSACAARAQVEYTADSRNVASRLKSVPESVGTPPPSEVQGGPYEFETGAVDAESNLAGPAGEYVEGEPVADFGSTAWRGPGRYTNGMVCSFGRGDGCCLDWHGLYIRGDYLLWWGKGFWAPPLVTTSDLGTSAGNAGVLGLASTSVLYPNSNLAGGANSGGRLRLGYWFDPCDTAAVEATYFGFGTANSNFSASDANYPILARPYVNVEDGSVGNDAALVAYPNLYTGNVQVTGSSSLQSVQVIFRHAICRGCDWRVDWLAGWRYNRLKDSLVISDARETLGTEVANEMVSRWDSFSTRNYFNGVELGLISEVRRGRWWLETRTTLSLGNNRAVVTIDGQSTTVTQVGAAQQTTTIPAGLLAQSTNIGSYTNDDFAIVPQIGLNLGWEIRPGWWATFGYNFMYWSRVARPGDQIDTDLNLSQVPPGSLVGLPRPAFLGAITDYWAQGMNFGLAYRY